LLENRFNSCNSSRGRPSGEQEAKEPSLRFLIVEFLKLKENKDVIDIMDGIIKENRDAFEELSK